MASGQLRGEVGEINLSSSMTVVKKKKKGSGLLCWQLVPLISCVYVVAQKIKEGLLQLFDLTDDWLLQVLVCPSSRG